MFPSEKRETHLNAAALNKPMNCELCGKIAELVNAMVEGVQMNVCAKCGSFGKVLRAQPAAAAPTRKATAPVRREPVQVEGIVSDFAQRIHTARERKGMTQQDFAKQLQVKESLLQKLESGTSEPDMDLARRLEKLLHVTLVEIREESVTISSDKEEPSAGLTIGDILKKKMQGL
jgi:putative transcription factor